MGVERQRSIPWARLRRGVLLVGCFAVVRLGAADAPKPFSEEAVRQWSRIEGWIGFWESDLVETYHYQASANGAQNQNDQSHRHSSAVFRLHRKTPDDGGYFDPEAGSFEWAGPGWEKLTFTAQTTANEMRGTGHDLAASAAGRRRLTDVNLQIRLTDGGRASFGVGWWDQPIVARETGTVRYEEGTGGGIQMKSRAVDRTFDATSVSPLANKTVTSGGEWPFTQSAGVILFDDEDVRADASGDTRSSFKFRGRVALSPVYDDLEVIVTIEGYEKWLPRGNLKAPELPGSHLIAHARLVAKRAGAGPAPKVKQFKFELSDVSREPGVCLNWPRFGPLGDTPPARDVQPDLRFAPESGAEVESAGLLATVEPKKEKTGEAAADARIDCFDFGGYATLKVRCVLADGREILGLLQQAGDELAMIPLPWREGGSLIAKAWADRVGLNGGDQEDNDEQPAGDGQKGDGFSNYEEYRGFAQNGGHLRTKPGRKDLFVLNRYGTRALPGIFRYTDLTGLAVHYELLESEVPDSRKLNRNRSADSPRQCAPDQFQHGLILDTVETGDASITHAVGDRWRPEFVSSVSILTRLCAPGSEDELATTIAHELSHAVGVHHHGEDDDYVAWLRKSEIVNGQKVSWFEERMARQNPITKQMEYRALPKTRIRIFIDEDREISPEGNFLTEPRILFLGKYGQQHSGDATCIMRYFCAEAYGLPERPRDRILSPHEAPGTSLCASPAGTDFNAAADRPGRKLPRYFDATEGACKDQFCVRDDAPNVTKTK